MKKHKPSLIIFIAIISIPLALYFIWNTFSNTPYYDIEIPYEIKNETDESIDVSTYVFDELNNSHLLLNKEETTINAEETKILSHPEYNNIKNRYFFIEIRQSNTIVDTFSAEFYGKASRFRILDNPLRIVGNK